MEVLAECSHPFTITTKSDRVTSVLDILAPMAEHNLVSVMISITSLTPEIARTLEPRAPRLEKRLAAVRSEEHTSELQSLMRISYAVFCLKKKQHHASTPTKHYNTV